MSGKSGNRRQGTFERVSLGELVGSSPAFAEQVRRSRDVIEGGALVRRMREMADGGAGISQEELARRLGLSQARISAIEKGGGTQGPTYELLKRVARACDLDFEPTIMPRQMAPDRPTQLNPPSPTDTEATWQELVDAQQEAVAKANQGMRRELELLRVAKKAVLASSRKPMWQSGDDSHADATQRLEQARALFKYAREAMRELSDLAAESSREAEDAWDQHILRTLHGVDAARDGGS